jgi:hypothetical protein
MTWRRAAQLIIQEALDARRPGTREEARRVIREAYPWGARENHPYKAWRQAANDVLDMRFPEPIAKEQLSSVYNVGLFEEAKS